MPSLRSLPLLVTLIKVPLAGKAADVQMAELKIFEQVDHLDLDFQINAS